MANRFAAVREYYQLIVTHNLYKRREKLDITQPVALAVRHELAEADHTGLGAAIQFTNGTRTGERLKDCQAIDTSRVAPLGCTGYPASTCGLSTRYSPLDLDSS